MNRSKPKTRIPAKERQLLLDFLRVIYVETDGVERKPPSPATPPKLLAIARKVG